MAEDLFKNRMIELANRAYTQGVYTFSDFLDMAQISMLYPLEKDFGQVPFETFGGQEGCERQIVRFGSKELLGYEMDYPIVCIHSMPLIKKFADELTHRDFLGAIMNLGIERDIIGDIMVKDKECYFFCVDNMAEYLMEHLEKVKHTYVKCETVNGAEIEIFRRLEEGEEIVSSERIDGIVSKIYKVSRNQSMELFREKKIFVNGRLCENHSYQVKKQDRVSVRGFGKFIYDGMVYQTKKDKLRIAYRKYIS